MKKWNKKFAQSIADKLKINLNKNHWNIIFCMRDFYKKYNITPSTRMLLTYMKKKNIFLTSQDLFILFPKGFMKYASQISGLPPNSNCF
ncbi:TusE/DsrC/DsvC family sulfur relay protein [Buchnera aphidicola]|uniref:Sulfurtransferase n=1 Tax=Buchnera aphidicola (Cinara cf. splendens/pseudotsugae 3390) TaxID=2518980 RepID=A0A451CWZ4_9GAMM|nr:TusE/DsrC/DsvC family sulfur relay protein [Buchnera aphidicola]VFP77870.1 Sulfurtransferase TusE [Buchnera aphidicola (Cinara cf. splendens/pseudotsugae 3390)]